jgi:hypothetical protein
MKTFTISAAAELLEKDRATLVRALRDINPDKIGTGRGGQQYKMSTIVTALERNADGGASKSSRSNSNANALSDADFAEQQFYVAEAFTRASDAVVEIGAAPEANRLAMVQSVFDKIDALTNQFVKANPDGKLAAEHQSIIDKMFSGVLFACDLELDASDKKRPCFINKKKNQRLELRMR